MLHYFVEKSVKTAGNITFFMLNTAIPALSRLEKRLLVRKYEKRIARIQSDLYHAKREHVGAYECIHYLGKAEDEAVKELALLKE